MKRLIIGFCLVLFGGYALVALVNLPTLNVGLLKLRGFCRLCDLTNANLEAMDLHGVDLYSATLTGADLSGADLSGADLEGANLEGACLEGTTGFTQTNYDGTPILEGCACSFEDIDVDGYDDVSYDAGYVDGAESGDVNLDGYNNILDVVTMVDNILNP